MSTGVATFQRGLTAHRAGLATEAIAAYRAAVAADPTLAAAHFNLGQLLRDQLDFGGAAAAFERAGTLKPRASDAWLNQGICREHLGELERALDCYREAARLEPDSAVAQFNSGNVMRTLGDLAGAQAAFARATERAPEAAEVWLNLGNVERELGRLDEAIGSLTRAESLRPDWPEARWNLALAYLASGQLERGWEGYDARWLRAGLSMQRGYPWPVWTGESPAGKRVLVWREQGLGDEILFATCIPDLIALGADVCLALDSRLVGLYQRALPEVRVVEDGCWGDGPFDYHVPLGNLPGLLRRSRTEFRARWSYLVPAREQAALWADRLATVGSGLRVGICWRSGLRTPDRRRYYAELQEWLPILAVPGVTFINLQYDECEAELAAAETASGIRIHRWPQADLRNDLEGVAGLLWHLDLVITAPTAVSSLAGAVGTETWQLDPGTDWTVFGEDRSPWLPATRLFRRGGAETNWSAAVGAVVAELTRRLADSAPIS